MFDTRHCTVSAPDTCESFTCMPPGYEHCITQSLLTASGNRPTVAPQSTREPGYDNCFFPAHLLCQRKQTPEDIASPLCQIRCVELRAAIDQSSSPNSLAYFCKHPTTIRPGHARFSFINNPGKSFFILPGKLQNQGWTFSLARGGSTAATL